MSAEPLPTPSGSTARVRRTEGLSRSAFARPVLALVPNPSRARRAPFVALILGVLLVGLLSLLLLNTTTAQDAFKLHRLQTSAADVADERQALSEQVNQLTGPGGLAGQAMSMGMVPAGAPVFWKPGEPLPPGARIFDGMIVVPSTAAIPATPAATTAPGEVAVTAVPRPGQSAVAPKASRSPSTSTKATAPKPSTSTSARPTTKASTPASTQSSTKPSTKPSTKASARTTGTAAATTTGTTTTTGSTR